MRIATAVVFVAALALGGPVFAQAELAKQVEALVRDVPRIAAAPKDIPLDPALARDMGFISSLAVDERAGLTYLLQRGTKLDPVIVVDRAGKRVRAWGKGLFKTPHSIRLDPAGNVWTVDSMSSTVLKFSAAGEKLLEIQVGEQPDPSKVSGTSDIAFAPNGHVFIADGYGNARILEYDAAGKRRGAWGTPGTGPSQFNVPHALLLHDDVLYVADRENGRIQSFDLTGKFLREWTGLVKPMSLARAADGGLLVGIGYRNDPGKQPSWLAWVVRLDVAIGKVTNALEVGDDAHGMAFAAGQVLTGGTTGPAAAVHMFALR